jgi:hypothetical protein
MADIASLFGLTPEGLSQQRYQQDLKQGYELAQLDPGAAARATLQSGVGQLGRGIAGMMGIEDPQMKLISARQSIIGQLDQTDPASLLKGAQMLTQMGDQQGAFALADYARKAQESIALAQQRIAEKMTPEQRNAMAFASSVAEKGTPQYNQAYQQTLNQLINKDKPELTTEQMKNAKAFALQAGPEGSPAYNAEYNTRLEQFTTKPELRPIIKEIGVAKTPGQEAVYTYQVGNSAPQQIIYKTVDGKQTIVPFSGGVDRTTSKTDIGVKLPPGESEFVKELGKLDAKAVSKAYEARGIAIDQLETLRKMAEVADRPVISGTLAEQRTDVSNFFNTIGLSSNKDRITTANSQEYIKYSTGLVLDNLRKTGYNPSNADMKVVQSIIPRLETDPMARRELIQFMSERANDVVKETTRLDIYARQNRGLSGYTPKIPQVNFNAAPSSTGRFPELSDAQIAERIRVLKQEQAK